MKYGALVFILLFSLFVYYIKIYPYLGTPCDDGDDDLCTAGTYGIFGCYGSKMKCDDGNPCTIDNCIQGMCTYRPVDDYPPMYCDDGDERTTGDKCDFGICAGVLNDESTSKNRKKYNKVYL